MQSNGFNEALDQVIAADPRFDREAYLFLRDALDHTLKLRRKHRSDISRHVNGGELLDGVRQYALRQFGPMVVTVFHYWGLRKCEDFGEMVFNLVGAGIFGKTETDSMEDFQNAYTFQAAFVEPFQPGQPVPKESRPRPPIRKIS